MRHLRSITALALFLVSVGVLAGCIPSQRRPYRRHLDDILYSPFCTSMDVPIVVDLIECDTVNLTVFNIQGECLSEFDTVLCEPTLLVFGLSWVPEPVCSERAVIRRSLGIDSLDSGIYFYKTAVGDSTFTKKLMLLKKEDNFCL